MSLTLVSSDNQSFTVPTAVAEISSLIKDMNDGEVNQEETFPMIGVDGATLAKILEFCEHYLSDPMPVIEKPIKSSDFSKLVPAWYDNFVNVDHTILFKFAEAANFMDVKPMLDLTCAKIASMIKDKSIHQIRDTFGITSEFTPEEEEKMREESKWCDE